MQRSKLIHLLSAFSRRELTDFEAWINSDYFNHNPLICRFYQFIRSKWKAIEQGTLRKEMVYQALFPDRPFDEQKLRYLMTDLTKLAEEYLVFLEFRKNEGLKKRMLLNLFKDRELEKHFTATLSHLENDQEKEKNRNNEYYLRQYIIDAAYNDFLSRQQNRSTDNSLQQVVDGLDLFYVSAKLKYCCEIINRKNVLAIEYEPLLLEEILSHLRSNPYPDVPAITIYYQILMTLTESENERHYYKLKDLLHQVTPHFSHEELKHMYTFALNYCIKKVNTGNVGYLKELFELYKVLLETRIIFENHVLSQWDYKNIVYVGLRLNEAQWTRKFIRRYKKMIPTHNRDNAYNYNLAYLHFYHQEYALAMELLQTVEFTDIFYNLDSKALLLKTYYELDEYLSMGSLIDSYSNYLRRNKKISDYQRTIYLNLVKYVKKLMRKKTGGKKPVEELEQEIRATKEIADIKWLLAKVEELRA